ncbi:hypothetical protein [Streptomyces sp. NPDC014685]|uniref:hypothetical protein n=1 Tax=Streptomyces sp. NPDC014685 TaxID=3364881 RepID=UPI0036FC64DE
MRCCSSYGRERAQVLESLTTTRIGNTSTAEVARRQNDGTWRWAIDCPKVLLASEL